MWNSTEGGSSADRLASPPVQEQQPAETSPAATAANTAAAVTSSSTAEVAPRCSCSSSHVSCSSYGGWVEDDPPPYASLVGSSADQSRPPDWSASYTFPGLPYEEGASGGAGRSIARPLVSIPLTSYGIFKIEPPRYAAAVRMCPQQPVPRIVPEAGPVVKSSSGSARKYGAILIAATVIVFLMALSLIVRFVTEKSLWRG